MYGKELIIDLHDCNPTKFTRLCLEDYFKQLCELIDMERCDLHFWDYEDALDEYHAAPDHLKGTSAIQFITTSNITVHTLDVLQKVFINIFSCKDFDDVIAKSFTEGFFEGVVVNMHIMDRI